MYYAYLFIRKNAHSSEKIMNSLFVTVIIVFILPQALAKFLASHLNLVRTETAMLNLLLNFTLVTSKKIIN